MPRIATAFFFAAVLYALLGMGIGVFMGATHDFQLRPLHAHINLLGWATLALMGAFYGIAGAHAGARLAWTNFTVSNLGNIGMLTALHAIVQGRPPNIVALIGGQVLIVGGMLIFGVAVLLASRKPAVA